MLPSMPWSDETNAASPALQGTVERVVFHDPRTRYTVMRLNVPGHAELVTAVGRSDSIDAGVQVDLQGVWGAHAVHGRQFEFSRLHCKPPTTPLGLRRRLAQYPGIKEVMAERIVARFGMDTLTVLNRQPRRLLEVDGVGPRTLEKVLAHHKTRVGPIAVLEEHLLEHGISPHLAASIHRRYGDASVTMLLQHPYRLARDVHGIGFVTADRIARALGLAVDSSERVEAGVLHAIEQAHQEGHCALPYERLGRAAANLLGVDDEAIAEAITRLANHGELHLEPACSDDGHEFVLCFDRELVLAEQNVAAAVARLAFAPRSEWMLPTLPDVLSDGQMEAVRTLARAGVLVLTGGPGTGKSTVVRHVIELARHNRTDLMLCAPTGRAAKRIEQATGARASTIHRLLEIESEHGSFVHNANNPLPPGLLVVDEASMLDLQLAEALLSALTPEHRLLLVGDADQLPSVGPGNVLRDVITCADNPTSPIPVVRLAQIFRQAHGSSIVRNAHRILAGELPTADETGTIGQFFAVPARDAERAHELVVRLATERIPSVYGFCPRADVQVLCPMHKGKAGTEAINHALQRHHGHERAFFEFGGAGSAGQRRLCEGDRVMQVKNDYNRGVFNGDIGVVVSVDRAAATVVVDMDGQIVRYEGKDLAALQLAYAVSIHKSQGSEFAAVIVPILTEHHVMLRRNLLYTAVTRARRLCVLVGDPTAIERAVRRKDAALRHTGLRRRLDVALLEAARRM